MGEREFVDAADGEPSHQGGPENRDRDGSTDEGELPDVVVDRPWFAAGPHDDLQIDGCAEKPDESANSHAETTDQAVRRTRSPEQSPRRMAQRARLLAVR